MRKAAVWALVALVAWGMVGGSGEAGAAVYGGDGIPGYRCVVYRRMWVMCLDQTPEGNSRPVRYFANPWN